MAFQARPETRNKIISQGSNFLHTNIEARRALRGIENNLNLISNKDKSVSVTGSGVSECSGYSEKENDYVKSSDRFRTNVVTKETKTHLVNHSEAFSSCTLPDGVTDIDSEDSGNQFFCSELVMDIYCYLRKLESQQVIRKDFLVSQREITPRMRAILVDWLNQVHSRFGLLLETLYLTVAIIDRFLQEYQVTRQHLQLVGVTAMFIASKYEEIFSPTVDDFLYITDNAYSKRDIFKMECLMLKTLEFSFARPLPLHFLRRNSKAGKCDAAIHTVAKYFMEISLQDYELAAIPPSLLAASALRLSLKIMDNAPWTLDLEYYSGYSEDQTNSVMTLLAELVLKNGSSKLQAVTNKYARSKQMKVSTFPQLRSKTMQEIAEGILV